MPTPEQAPAVDDRHLHEFLPAALAIIERPPSPIGRTLSISIGIFMIITLCWMYFSSINVVVSAPGKVVPKGAVKVIQAPESAQVLSIHIRNGQRVEQGQILLELDATTSSADRKRLSLSLSENQAVVARLVAQISRDSEKIMFPADTPSEVVSMQQQILASNLLQQRERLATMQSDIDQKSAEAAAIDEVIKKLLSTVPLLKTRLAKKRKLLKKGFVSELDVIDAELDATNQERELAVQRKRLIEANAGIRAARQRRDQTTAEFEGQGLMELAEAKRQVKTLAQELTKASHKESMQVLRSPVDGTVQQLAVNTVGGVVTAAETLMVVVPENMGLEIDAKVANKDIGHLEEGQEAAVKVETFSFTRHGSIRGKIEWIGKDAVDDPVLGPVYPVRISMESTQVPNQVDGRQGKARPGMAVTADVTIGNRSILDYFLAPILRYRDQSLRER